MLSIRQLYYQSAWLIRRIVSRFGRGATLGGALGFLLGIPVNIISRKAEYAADAFAVRLAGKEPAISVFKTLAQENLANLNPHPLYVWFYYNHPTIPQRLSAIHALPDEA